VTVASIHWLPNSGGPPAPAIDPNGFAPDPDEPVDTDSAAGLAADAPAIVKALHRSELALVAVVSERTRDAHDRRSGAGDRRGAPADRVADIEETEAPCLDDLTGAHRRGVGLMELQREMARARRTRQALVVAFVDVDGLKAINESRGHVEGDRVLREIANVLRANLRSYDLVVRFGGDEFLCILPGLGEAEAIERMAAVNAILARPPDHWSVSIGIAHLEADDTVELLVGRADGALYQQPRPRFTNEP
jgi:diguanylate cyclase (GGDEF)-like protein